MITGRQIRAARALLGISQEGLATAAGLTKQGVSKIEDGSVQPREGTVNDIARVFNDRGIEFTENEGVRIRPEGVEIFEGKDRFEDFYDFMYEHLSQNGGDVCLSIYDETFLVKNRKDPEIHRERMRCLVKRGNVTFRTLATKSEFATNNYMELKWLPNQNPVSTGFYAFGECLALMSFVDPLSPYVIVIKSGQMATAYREGFTIAWENAQKPPEGGTV